jgi:hypothetical protein
MRDGQPLPENPAWPAWREAVADITKQAKAKLPGCSERVESAVKIVLAGNGERLLDNTTRVVLQSNGSMAYQGVNGHCNCQGRQTEEPPSCVYFVDSY